MLKPLNQSIHGRLTLWLFAGTGLLLLGAGLALDQFISQRLQQDYDEVLLAKAQALVILTEQENGEAEIDFADEFMPEFDADENPGYFQLWLSGNEVLERSRSLRDNDLTRFENRVGEPRFADVELPDGRRGRSVQIDFIPQIDEDEDGEESTEPETTQETLTEDDSPLLEASLVLALGREKLDEFLDTIHLTLLTTGLITMILIVLLVRHTVRRGLVPLDDIRAQLIEMDAEALSTRLHMPQRTEELEELVAQFNGMLERLQSAFNRERQFSADVAHELRTPLAELRSLAEVGGQWPEDAELARDFFGEVLAASRQMERMVVNLLALARCEKGMEVVDLARHDLITLVDAAWKRASPDADAKQLTFHRSGPDNLAVETSRDQFELILNNLFSNAITYSPAGSDIHCEIKTSGNSFGLSVTNRAEHLEPGDLPRLFDRLWRKDAARTGDHHAGLGLTLVKTYAQQLQLRISTQLPGGDTFCISLQGLINTDSQPRTKRSDRQPLTGLGKPVAT